jgi:hypothetical protein
MNPASRSQQVSFCTELSISRTEALADRQSGTWVRWPHAVVTLSVDTISGAVIGFETQIVGREE